MCFIPYQLIRVKMAADTQMKSVLKITSRSERRLLSQRVYFALDERILGFMKHMFKVFWVASSEKVGSDGLSAV